MEKMIKRMADGNCGAERCPLSFSCSNIVITVEKGGVYEGSFRIFGTPSVYSQGHIYSSHQRMECRNSKFLGNEEEITFVFDSTGLEAGSVVKGQFLILSNQGEYEIPYEVTVKAPVLLSSQGIIADFSTYIQLAKENWREAVRLFYAPGFGQILQGDKTLSENYAMLSVYPGNEQNVEEFLISAGKKQYVDYVLQMNSLQVELPLYGDGEPYVSEQFLPIMKNGWGYTNLEVICDGDFIYTEKSLLTDDDFLGAGCRLPVYIDTAYCRVGRNFGRITLRNSYLEISIPVMARFGREDGRSNASIRQKRMLVELMEYYQAYRMRKITKTTWLEETGKVIDQMLAVDEQNINARLMQAHLLITQGNFNEAGWTLDYVSELMQSAGDINMTLDAYYLYLTTLIHNNVEYTVEVTSHLEHIYRHDVSNWRVAWLLLYLSEEYNKSASGKWVFLEKQFQAGATSPILYIEALNILNQNPALLRKLDRFELQLLYFGAKQDYLSGEVVDQILYLTERTREYSQILLRLLSILYKQEKSIYILREICSLLIKGNRIGNEYFRWFKAGVEENLRITNLYEYYMMSLDLNQEQKLPKILLLYFSYQTNLDYARVAYLYDYVLRNRYEMPDVYDAYQDKIKDFAIQQMKRGRVDKHLANIYHQVLKADMVDQENCFMLSRILFAYQISVKNNALRKVYVYHRGSLHPQEYQLNGNTTWIALYDVNDRIVFEDAHKNRFLQSAEFTKKSLTRDERYLEWLLPFDCENLQLDLYLAAKGGQYTKEQQYAEARMLRIARDEWVSRKIKVRAYLTLIKQYLNMGRMEDVAMILEGLPIDKMLPAELEQAASWAMESGNYPWIAKLFMEYGEDIISHQWVNAEVWNAFPEDAVEMYNQTLLSVAKGAFALGCRDENVLMYLIGYAKGTCAYLLDLWTRATEAGIACRYLEERLLAQFLVTGATHPGYGKLLKSYFSMEPKPMIRDAIVKEKSHRFLTLGEVAEGPVFDEIRTLFYQGEVLSDLEKLAFLKYCVVCKEYRKCINDEEMIGRFLRDLLHRNICMDFMSQFNEFAFVNQVFADKVVVEFYGNPKENVQIRYRVEEIKDTPLLAGEDIMKPVCPGVYSMSFVLFFGETLSYTLVWEDAEGEQTLDGSVTKQEPAEGTANGQYAVINKTGKYLRMQEYSKVQTILEECHRKEYIVDGLFKAR
ncbi:MAG: hypothetical protein IJB84_02750 [Lachnospiraceae bacterium]|nr:hypothetical protein [Lachnospiraceae bacterium]